MATESPRLIDIVRNELRLRATDAEPTRAIAFARQAVVEAHRRGAADDVAEVALLAAVCFDRWGRFDDAMALLRFALDWTPGPSEVRAHLLAARAAILALRGDVIGAHRDADEARHALPPNPCERARLEVEVYRHVVACIALDGVAPAELTRAVSRAHELGFNWLATGLAVWLVPWLAAHGRPTDAALVADSLYGQALAAGHQVRIDDAEAFRSALRVLGRDEATPACSSPTTAYPRPGAPGSNARWRSLLVELRGALLAARWTEAEALAREVEAATWLMNPGFRHAGWAFSTLVLAQRGADPGPLPASPPAPTLANLAPALAAAETAAVAGTPADCASWRRLLERLPSGVVTCLEWPASVDRLRALLAVRLGDHTEAARRFQSAAASMDAIGHPVEATITRLQWSELAGRRAWRARRAPADARREAVQRLAAAGVEPVPIAYAAGRTLGERSSAHAALSPRELEVLRLLAGGATYRIAGRQLGLSWRTVQTHATNAYRKLGVHGRASALDRARRDRLL